MEQIKLDEQKLHEMAQQYAMQGAEKAIKDFYTGYDSPFMKEVQRELKEKMETNLFFELSQMTAAINQALNDKVSEMANTVVANTFLPMLNRMFSQEKKTVVTTQDLYEHFGDALKEELYDEFDPELMELEIKESPGSFSKHLYLHFIYDNDTKFELSLMDNRDPDKDEHGNTLYMITELPGCSQYRADYSPRERQMRIRLKEGATLEMPFTPDVLRDEFMRYVAGLLLTNTLVTVKNYHEYHLEEDWRMTNEEIKRKFGEVQGILDSLQGSDATCMFIGHEGNHFVISGSPTNISAQIVFAMMRYPIVRDIIKTCAERFDELNRECGDGARNVTMDHLIEVNSGNNLKD